MWTCLMSVHFSVWCFSVYIRKKEQITSNLQNAKALCPEVWSEPLGQSNSMPLDVVCHFLLTGLAAAQQFAGVWEKPV